MNEKHKYERMLDDSSEKLARITVRRGKIEEKLRGLIQTNFTLKFGKKAKEHMIDMAKKSTADKTQEARLQSKDLKDAMQELYFSQLKTFMIKDWNRYQMLFPDRVKFEQFFEIINAFRVDAHAKTLDEEDEALLNYAFKYFEKALEVI